MFNLYLEYKFDIYKYNTSIENKFKGNYKLSQYKSVLGNSFGKSLRQFIDTKNNSPGPGSYNLPELK